MSIPTEDVFLEDVITEALDRTTAGEGNATTARRIIDAIAGKSSTWMLVDPTRKYLDVATPLGDYSASGPSCTHLYSYDSTSGSAGDPSGEQPDYFHLCELDDHIALLVALREARRRFEDGEQLPVCDHTGRSRRFEGNVVVEERCQCCGKQFGEAVPTPPMPVEPVAVAVLEPAPEMLVPCPGGQCPHYLYGVRHEHTARAQ